MTIDRTTKRWIRNEADERAAANGCRFNALRGAWTVYWIERMCKLYEGEGYAGTPLILHGCKKCDHSKFYAVQEPWWLDEECTEPGPAQELHAERARLFAECVRKGHDIDWQYEVHMRLYGWEKYRTRWQRMCRRFKQGSIWIPKKQKKSPTAAANGLYLTVGDGEPGNNVYLCAKDGAQAREIAAKHTVEMYRQSADLQAECSLNLSLMQISHEPSRSRLKPLSSANSRTQQSKEGLNGSIIIDETHVVDREFVDRVSRAGISRSEPLFLEFSTAGNNPDGYGKERCDYCRDVLNGVRPDEELFAAIYEAPQDISDEDLERDFEKYSRLANPAMGHTIDPEEIRSDYERSKASLAKLGLFKMYRLNIWQQTDSPWIRQSDWSANGDKYDWSMLKGRRCYLGLDLAKVRDTTAIYAIFPPEEADGEYRSWVRVYLPTQTANDVAALVPYREWERDGYVELIEGDVCDYEEVRAGLNWFKDNFEVLGLAYDPYFADLLVQRLIEEDGWPVEIIQKFPQTVGNFAGPTEEFERLIIDRRMRHPRNKVLDWQIGHCKVKTDVNRNKRPVKPKHGDHRTIDIPVAGIMALGLAMQGGGQQANYYDNHEVEFV